MTEKKFSETSLPEKDFYSNLNMEDIADADYRQPKKLWEASEIKIKLS